MLDNLNDQDRPDYSGYFIGTVVFNNDPEHIERIKVSIPGLFAGDTSTLPWLGKKKAELFPAARDGSYGTFGLVPLLGTQVIVEFQNSNPLYGLYSATPHQTNERVSEALTNYLYRYGFKDPAGNLFMIDTKPGSVEILIKHKSGTLIKIGDGGDITSIAGTWNHTGEFWVDGNVHTSGNVVVGTGASGTFSTSTGNVVTVRDGIITNIF